MTVDSSASTEGHIRLNADLGELERLTAWLDAFCDRHEIPDEAHYHSNLAVEELVINAIKHGRCSPAEGAIEVGVRLSGQELNITITDTGIPFNPLNAPPAGPHKQPRRPAHRRAGHLSGAQPYELR